VSAPDPVRVRAAHHVPVWTFQGRGRRLVLGSRKAFTPIEIPGIDPADMDQRIVTVHGECRELLLHGKALWRRMEEPVLRRPSRGMTIDEALDLIGSHARIGGNCFGSEPWVPSAPGRRLVMMVDGPRAQSDRTVREDLGEEAHAYVARRLSRDLRHDGRHVYFRIRNPVLLDQPRPLAAWVGGEAPVAWPGTHPSGVGAYLEHLDAHPHAGHGRNGFEEDVWLAHASQLARELEGVDPDDGEVAHFANRAPAAILDAIALTTASGAAADPVLRAHAEGLLPMAVRGSLGMLEGGDAMEAVRSATAAGDALLAYLEGSRRAAGVRAILGYAHRIAAPRLERANPFPAEDLESLGGMGMRSCGSGARLCRICPGKPRDVGKAVLLGDPRRQDPDGLGLAIVAALVQPPGGLNDRVHDRVLGAMPLGTCHGGCLSGGLHLPLAISGTAAPAACRAPFRASTYRERSRMRSRAITQTDSWSRSLRISIRTLPATSASLRCPPAE
jgi:hypothetical protein